MRFVNHQVVRGEHPSIGWAIAADLNTYEPSVRVVGIIYHPPNSACTWRNDRGEFAEVLLELAPLKPTPKRKRKTRRPA